MRRALPWTAGAVGVLAVAFLLGPRPRVVDDWTAPDVGADPEGYLRRVEAGVSDLRPGEAKTIVRADTAARSRTPLALVYLHGFSADRHELDPVPARVAARLGANLYYARLTGHGRDGAAMAEASVRRWFDDVAEAMAVARALGQRVVLIGTSTGGTLAMWAAGQEAWRDEVAALVLVSPNLGLRDPSARLLLWPWGALITRLALGPERCFEPASAEEAKHWTVCYPSRALVPMMALVEHVRTMPLERVVAPALVLYSGEDRLVDPAETRRLFDRLGATAKRLVEVTGSGDPARHVLAGDIMSPGATGRVVDEIVAFVSMHDHLPGGAAPH